MSNKISPNFGRHEFRCRCGCGFDTVDVVLLQVLEHVRLYFSRPVVITSGCRCLKYNASPDVGGSKNSQHLYGRAADFIVQGVDPEEVYTWLDETYKHRFGIGKYSGWTHVDSRTDGPARW